MGAAGIFLGGLLAAGGVAGAQVEQCAASCTPRPPEALPAIEIRTQAPGAPGSGVAPGNESRTGAPASAGPAALESSAPGGGLPVTGGDVLGLSLLGAGAIGAGTVLVRRSRRTATPA